MVVKGQPGGRVDQSGLMIWVNMRLLKDNQAR